MKEYINFAKTKKNTLIIDTSKNNIKNLLLITKKINSIVF